MLADGVHDALMAHRGQAVREEDTGFLHPPRQDGRRRYAGRAPSNRPAVAWCDDVRVVAHSSVACLDSRYVRYARVRSSLRVSLQVGRWSADDLGIFRVDHDPATGGARQGQEMDLERSPKWISEKRPLKLASRRA
jgi:hypothetical protein